MSVSCHGTPAQERAARAYSSFSFVRKNGISHLHIGQVALYASPVSHRGSMSHIGRSKASVDRRRIYIGVGIDNGRSEP